MDLTASIQPKSDQLNADSMLGGPRTFTIEKVTKGNAEQPVNIHLVESPGRPWRPSKSMIRVLVSAWGKESDVYSGRLVTLYRNPKIKFGGEEVGGIEVSHMSHLDGPMKVSLTVTRGKKRLHPIEPLTAQETTFTVPDLPTPEAFREHWIARRDQGASKAELDAISAAAATVQPTEPPEEPTA